MKQLRKCIVCGYSFPQQTLVRLGLTKEKILFLLPERAHERSLYVCFQQHPRTRFKKRKQKMIWSDQLLTQVAQSPTPEKNL